MKPRLILPALALLFLVWWNWPRPDVFLKKFGFQIPPDAKITHRSSESLTSETHFVKVTVGPNQVKALISQFAKQERYDDLSNDLKKHYKSFVSGREDFFPPQPRSFLGGSFLMTQNKYPFLFSYLVDQDNASQNEIYLYIWSPDN